MYDIFNIISVAFMINLNARAQLNGLMLNLEGAYAPNTLRAYRADMLEFITYCNETDQHPLPSAPATVAAFLLKTMSQGIKTATIRRKASSISAIHRLSNHQDPTKHSEVRIAMRKVTRQLGTRFDQAYPITRPLLDRLLAVCSDELRGLRDRALLLIAYDSMRRRSELVSLRFEDIEWHFTDGASILLRRSKTDQYGSGQWIHLSTAATSAVQEWLSAAGLTEGFVLRGILPNGTLSEGLCESRVSRILKTLATRAGLESPIVEGISGHSMRVGGAQDLLLKGASIPQIMVKGGWRKTDTVIRYVERIRLPSKTG